LFIVEKHAPDYSFAMPFLKTKVYLRQSARQVVF